MKLLVCVGVVALLSACTGLDMQPQPFTERERLLLQNESLNSLHLQQMNINGLGPLVF